MNLQAGLRRALRLAGDFADGLLSLIGLVLLWAVLAFFAWKYLVGVIDNDLRACSELALNVDPARQDETKAKCMRLRGYP